MVCNYSDGDGYSALEHWLAIASVSRVVPTSSSSTSFLITFSAVEPDHFVVPPPIESELILLFHEINPRKSYFFSQNLWKFSKSENFKNTGARRLDPVIGRWLNAHLMLLVPHINYTKCSRTFGHSIATFWVISVDFERFVGGFGTLEPNLINLEQFQQTY